MEIEIRESDEWCFVCKDGGRLVICNYENCPKAYHARCVGKTYKSLANSEEWTCGWHSCKCGNPPTSCCYCCPKAICRQCLDNNPFYPIKEKYGFCDKCRKLALFCEIIIKQESNGEKVEDLSRSKELFKEYYELIKEREGLSSDDIRSAKRLLEAGDKSNIICDQQDIKKKDGKRGKKRIKGHTRKLNLDESSENKAAISKEPESSVASIIPANIRLIFLTKHLLEELLKKPETENKVIGSFIRVKSSPDHAHSGIVYQLMQVAGIKKGPSDGENANIMLQVYNMPNDISIDIISNRYFFEDECEVLRRKMDAGLLKKPTVEELEQKARSLHKEITEYCIAEEKRTLQAKIDHAHEKGRKLEFTEYCERMQQLEDKVEVAKLMNTFPKVVAEVGEVEPTRENVTNDKMRNKGSQESMLITNRSEGDKNVLEMNLDEQMKVVRDQRKSKKRGSSSAQAKQPSKQKRKQQPASKKQQQQKQPCKWGADTGRAEEDTDCSGMQEEPPSRRLEKKPLDANEVQLEAKQACVDGNDFPASKLERAHQTMPSVNVNKTREAKEAIHHTVAQIIAFIHAEEASSQFDRYELNLQTLHDKTMLKPVDDTKTMEEEIEMLKKQVAETDAQIEYLKSQLAVTNERIKLLENSKKLR